MELLEALLNMRKSSGFHTQLCSDLNFEGMIIDVCFDDQLIAQVNYEKGIDQIEVQFFPGNTSTLAFKISDFIEILEKAKNIAIRCAKEDNEKKI